VERQGKQQTRLTQREACNLLGEVTFEHRPLIKGSHARIRGEKQWESLYKVPDAETSWGGEG
jgi:hypothetical protein